MTVDDFVKCLADSGLIAANEVEKLRTRLANNEALREAEKLAFELVNEKLLTKYQAKILLQGDSGGLVLGNYTILDKIGEGGMGQVFKAWHRRMKRVVALKTLPSDLTRDEKAIQRFRREVETAAQLTHRNIVTSHDADEVGGIHFLVMEYVEGSNLAAFVAANGPMFITDAIRCILDASHGLLYAHQQGVVHRDIKPANLLLDSKGMVKVLDMGLARTQFIAPAIKNASEPGLTSEQTVVGTADYLAPEQALSPRQADHRVDIYSLGISLYYLLTGSIPYPGETVLERLLAHRERPIPSVADARPDSPPQLNAICAKMMARNASDRYENMASLIRDLEDCLRAIAPNFPEGTPILPQKRPPSPVEDKPTGEWDFAKTTPLVTSSRRPRPRIWIAGGTLLLLLAAAFWMSRTGRTPPLQSQLAATSASGTNPTASAKRPPEDSKTIFRKSFPSAPQYSEEVFDAAEAQRRQQAWAKQLGIQIESTSPLGMPLVLVPPGTFRMGTSEEESVQLSKEARESGLPDWYIESLKDEVPARSAEVVFPMLVSKYEVPAAIYRLVVAAQPSASPSSAGASDARKMAEPHPRPADSVTWMEAVEFCNALSKRENLSLCYEISGRSALVVPGTGYRLPTEMEWEYVCRAGTTTRWSFGDDISKFGEYGHAGESKAEGCSPSGLLLANTWGIHDMHGNLWEWCYDGPTIPAGDRTETGESAANRRVVRGGSFAWPAPLCRSANRTHYISSFRKNTHGFRVAREIRESSAVSSDK